MAKFKTLKVEGWEPAIRGMRHPLKSYDRADSYTADDGSFILGKNDYDLAKRLVNAGSAEHAKFLRMIAVWVDITADRGWWQEYATYKVGTVENSQSTMHRLAKDGIHEEDLNFRWGFDPDADKAVSQYLIHLNQVLRKCEETEDRVAKKRYFQLAKAMLPEGYMQTRTCFLNYQVLRNMYSQRKNHQLPSWSEDFVSWVHTLPYHQLITGVFDD